MAPQLAVVAAEGEEKKQLDEYVRQHRDALMRSLRGKGHLSMRGFKVTSVKTFQAAVDNLGRRPMTDYLPAEYGRDTLHSAKAIYHTNVLHRTGAYLTPEVLPHSENYYALHPPRLIAFWCEKSSWIGGGTLIVDGVAAYKSLNRRIRSKLTRRACTVRRIVSKKRLAKRYGVGPSSVAKLVRECVACGVHVVPFDRVAKYRCDFASASHLLFSFVKPSIISSSGPGGSSTDEKRASLAINFGEFGGHARNALFSELEARGYFDGLTFAPLRMLWYIARLSSLVSRMLPIIDALPIWFCRPLRKLAAWREARDAERIFDSFLAALLNGVNVDKTLGDTLSSSDAAKLGQVLAQEACMVEWRVDDVLLLDNTRTLHDGLPGVGPRCLRVALADAMPLPQRHLSGGLFEDDGEVPERVF